MWVASSWETEEDVEKDILLMAEYCTPTREEMEAASTKVPDTVLQYRRQMAENKQRTLNSDIDESASYIVSGRGRGIVDRVIRPGGIVDCHPSDDTELRKQIRQVAGFGYSNQLIETSIKAKVYEPEEGDDNCNFKLVSSASSPSSNKSSTESTPTRKKKSLN